MESDAKIKELLDALIAANMQRVTSNNSSDAVKRQQQIGDEILKLMEGEK